MTKERSLIEIERTDRWLEENHHHLLERFRMLLRADSVTGHEGPAQQMLVAHLRDFGLPVDVQPVDAAALHAAPGYLDGNLPFVERPNVVTRLPGRGGGRNLLLTSHIDVVVAGAGWRHDPWGAEMEDGRIYARGACDAKGCLWAAVCALVAVYAVGVPLRGDLVVASAVEEETTGNGTLELCRRGLRTDGAVVLEPTDHAVCYGHQGILGVRVDVPGVAGHGSRRSDANAIVRAAEVVTALHRLQSRWTDPLRPDYPPPVINIARIAGGQDLYITPDDCTIEATVRFPPGHEGEVRAALLAAADRSWLDADGEARAQVSIPFAVAPAHTASEAALVQALLSAARSIQPATPLGPFPATCDARHITAAGIPAAIFGPGSLARAHAADEYLSEDELLDAARILVRLVLAWCR